MLDIMTIILYFLAKFKNTKLLKNKKYLSIRVWHFKLLELKDNLNIQIWILNLNLDSFDFSFIFIF